MGELGDRRSREAAPRLRALLIETIDARLRNRCAYALAMLRDEEAFLLLVQLVQRPDLMSSSGTLVWALTKFDCTRIAPTLINSIVYGSYEAGLWAHQALEELEARIAADDRRACIEIIRRALADPDTLPERDRKDRIAMLKELADDRGSRR